MFITCLWHVYGICIHIIRASHDGIDFDRYFMQLLFRCLYSIGNQTCSNQLIYFNTPKAVQCLLIKLGGIWINIYAYVCQVIFAGNEK